MKYSNLLTHSITHTQLRNYLYFLSKLYFLGIRDKVSDQTVLGMANSTYSPASVYVIRHVDGKIVVDYMFCLKQCGCIQLFCF